MHINLRLMIYWLPWITNETASTPTMIGTYYQCNSNNNSKNHLIKDTLDKILNVNNKDNNHQLKMNMNEKYQISNSTSPCKVDFQNLAVLIWNKISSKVMPVVLRNIIQKVTYLSWFFSSLNNSKALHFSILVDFCLFIQSVQSSQIGSFGLWLLRSKFRQHP